MLPNELWWQVVARLPAELRTDAKRAVGVYGKVLKIDPKLQQPQKDNSVHLMINETKRYNIQQSAEMYVVILQTLDNGEWHDQHIYWE